MSVSRHVGSFIDAKVARKQARQASINVVNQMCLGEVIEALSKASPEDTVVFDFGYFRPNGLSSYRGYYEDIAFGYIEDGKDVPALGILKKCRSKIGTIDEGYKGGNGKATSDDTAVWVANYGESPDVMLVNIVKRDNEYLFVTMHEDSEIF